MGIEAWMDCRDIRASVAFYTQVLDFELKVAPHPDPENFDSRHAVLSRDGDILHLDSHARENGAFGTQIYVRVTNVDALCERFVANGLHLTVPKGGTAPVDQTWGMREIAFRDPDGNRLCFGQPLG
ncbi:MAG: VOC family protein [Pseudomonadota bacterium]